MTTDKATTATLLKLEHHGRGRAMVVRCPRGGCREVHRLDIGEQPIGAARVALCVRATGRVMYMVVPGRPLHRQGGRNHDRKCAATACLGPLLRRHVLGNC